MKHKYCDVIIAWAEGNPIQFSDDGGIVWYDALGDSTPDFSFAHTIWRIKPKPIIKRYRIALMNDRNSKLEFYFRLQNENEDESFGPEESPAFVRWISSWIEYDVS